MIIYTESYCVIAREGQKPELGPELRFESREKRDRMKKIFVYIVMFGLLAGMLSGCGGEYTGKSSGEGMASGTAVSAAAVVSGSGIKEKAEKEEPAEAGLPMKYTFANDRNLYTGSIGSVEQRSLEGEMIREWDLYEANELFYVDNEYLYYVGNSEEEDGETDVDFLYSVPLREGEDGNDILLLKKEKKVVDTSFVASESNRYADSRYVIWIEEIKQEFIKYDRKTKKKQKRKIEWGQFAVICGKIVACFDGKLYVQELESDQWQEIGEAREPVTWNDEYFFYRNKDGYKMYDVKKGESILLISEAAESMWERMKKDEGVEGKKTRCSFVGYDDLFCDNDKLYLQIRYSVGEDGAQKCALYSVDYKNGGREVKYEDQIIDKLFDDNYSGQCIDVVNGKLFVKREWEDDYRYYDLVSKKIHTFKEETDPAYYEMQSDIRIEERLW